MRRLHWVAGVYFAQQTIHDTTSNKSPGSTTPSSTSLASLWRALRWKPLSTPAYPERRCSRTTSTSWTTGPTVRRNMRSSARSTTTPAEELAPRYRPARPDRGGALSLGRNRLLSDRQHQPLRSGQHRRLFHAEGHRSHDFSANETLYASAGRASAWAARPVRSSSARTRSAQGDFAAIDQTTQPT